MTARALMIQGTGSDVGKSLVVAGLCRLAYRRGIKVAPFKPQNMSNNAAATSDGGEIGRAQALQARACHLDLNTDFNPVLLKPQSDNAAQVVVHGRVRQTSEASKYMNERNALLHPVIESFTRLSNQFELILVEGAGSPAEVNLRERDIANMGFAQAAGVPVCLLGDIDRGGVIAAIAGTKAVLDEADAKMIIGYAINKFRGDPALFEDGLRYITWETNWPCFGVIPWLAAASKLPAEDAVALQSPTPHFDGAVKIAAPMFSRIANFDDADPLRLDPNVEFQFTPPGKPLPRDADAIILFGTKSTISDLAFLRSQGWDHDIIAHARAGGAVFGVCGGMQMLGKRIIDEGGADGAPGEAQGFGFLDIDTSMRGDKRVRPVTGLCTNTGAEIVGYEIHVGKTHGPDIARPIIQFPDGTDGATSSDGRIAGSYVHGLFANDAYRTSWLQNFCRGNYAGAAIKYEQLVDSALSELADGIEAALNVDQLFEAARPVGWRPA